MEITDVQELLAELPAIGPLFAGSLIAVALRIAGLIVAVVVGIKLLRWAWGRGGAPPVESERALVKQGRFEEVGDRCSRKGELETALNHYKKAEAWLKAGHASRRLGRYGDAAKFFEKAKEIKLAIASFEAAGQDGEVARLAELTADPALLSKAGKWFESKGDMLKAGRFLGKAGLLKEAEGCYLQTGEAGRAAAIRMYIDAYETRTQFEGKSHAVRELALRAATLMYSGNQRAQAVQLCNRAGLDPNLLDETRGGSGNSPPPAKARAQREVGFTKPTPDRQPAASPKPNDLSIDAPVLSNDAFLEEKSPSLPSVSPQGSPPLPQVAPKKTSPAPKEEAPRPRRHKPQAHDVADALLMVLEEEEGADDALKMLPSELRQEVSEEAVTMDIESPSESASSGLSFSAVSSAVKFSSDVTDRYTILGEIGVGGMGEVFKAKDLSLGREVALKFLSSSMVGDDKALHLFLREARAVAALNHPTIVTVFDIGILDGRPFICMEYVEGTDLATRIKEEGTLDVGEALGITIQLAKALDYAHVRNVVHRDIKPSNVILTSSGVVKILDFGLAKAIQGNKKKSTYVAGTPEYMSPEQLAGRMVDGRGDLFSLGVLLYELLTGSLPFEGALRSSNFEPPSARAPWLPTALDDVIGKALTLAAVDRFQNGDEMIKALKGIGSDG